VQPHSHCSLWSICHAPSTVMHCSKKEAVVVYNKWFLIKIHVSSGIDYWSILYPPSETPQAINQSGNKVISDKVERKPERETSRGERDQQMITLIGNQSCWILMTYPWYNVKLLLMCDMWGELLFSVSTSCGVIKQQCHSFGILHHFCSNYKSY